MQKPNPATRLIPGVGKALNVQAKTFTQIYVTDTITGSGLFCSRGLNSDSVYILLTADDGNDILRPSMLEHIIRKYLPEEKIC